MPIFVKLRRKGNLMKRIRSKMLIVCICIMCSIAGIDCLAQEDNDNFGDTSNIRFPLWMEKGQSAPIGIEPYTNGEDNGIVSILGDSLGTYDGYTPWGIHYFYYCDKYMDVNETWWMRYINNHKMRLGVNESLGGSKVAWQEGDSSGYNASQCMASEERIRRLGANGTPNVILFFGGTNDIAASSVGEFEAGENIGDVSTFYSAYQTAIVRLKQFYPNAEIVCITPYYRDISSWSDSTNQDVDIYAECILNICNYYNIRCVDLRQANIDQISDMCKPDNLHVNQEGAYKIWYMLENNRAKLGTKGVDIITNGRTGIEAKFNITGYTPDVEYQWQVYDCDNNAWIFTGEWEAKDIFHYEPPHSGNYWLYCTARNDIGDLVSSVAGTYYEKSSISINGLCWIYKNTEISVGASYSSDNDSTEFKWEEYNLETHEWSTISDWSNGNWSDWRPRKGNYWLHVTGRTSDGDTNSYTIAFAVNRNYPVYISGKYQGPNPYGLGWLIGVSSNDNPHQKYKYELLVLDCDKYLKGDLHPWIYGTGLQRLTEGKTFWTTWSPPHRGYYWTYFRIYDESGMIIEDQCYGAAFL